MKLRELRLTNFRQHVETHVRFSDGLTGIIGAILPLIMTVGITALEFLVAFLQAYVFTMLTCMYINDALHPDGH